MMTCMEAIDITLSSFTKVTLRQAQYDSCVVRFQSEISIRARWQIDRSKRNFASFLFYLLHFELVSSHNRPQHTAHDLRGDVAHDSVRHSARDARPHSAAQQ